MFRKNDVPLKIELFSGGEDGRFNIHSNREIQFILKGIAHEGTRTALYYEEGNAFILTTMLKVSEQGMWLEIGPIAASNQRILRSDKIIFISSYHQAKVQFVTNRIENSVVGNCPAFYMPLPDSLLRIQRREYFRLTTPVTQPLKCIIPFSPPVVVDEMSTPASKREITIMDISGGGIALVCEAHDTTLIPGKIYAGCMIQLPGVGTITTAVKVQNSFEVTLRNGQRSKRAGCEFAQLSGEAATLLQRYVVQLQSEAIRLQDRLQFA